MTRALAAVVALSLVIAGTAAAAVYPSTAQKLAPPANEITFTSVLAFQKAKKPTGTLAHHYKGGVAAIYEKGTAKKPTEAVATIYVYSSASAAQSAWTASCTKCTKQQAPTGLRLKAEAGTVSGVPTLHEVTECSNVFLDVVEQSKTASNTQIDKDVVAITDAVLARAIHFGLSSCTAK